HIVVHEERIRVGRVNEIMPLDHVLPAMHRESVREKLSDVRTKIVSFKPVWQTPKRPPKRVLLPQIKCAACLIKPSAIHGVKHVRASRLSRHGACWQVRWVPRGGMSLKRTSQVPRASGGYGELPGPIRGSVSSGETA